MVVVYGQQKKDNSWPKRGANLSIRTDKISGACPVVFIQTF